MKLLAAEFPARPSRALAHVFGALAIVALIGCPEPTVEADVDVDRGPVEATLTASDRINWPGLDHGSGREILYTHGFAEGRPVGYWFLGFAQRKTADSFWFCRDGDTQCPLDDNHRINWSHLVGNPLFMRLPGQPGFSAFWQVWVVRVPESYEADSIKTIGSLHRRTLDGELEVSELITDFGTLQGEAVGPRETILHCALALAGTTLALNGTRMVDDTGEMLRLELKQGWHEGLRVNFVDFSPTDGVFPAADDTETRPLMPMANIYILWRSCDVPEGTPRPPICDLPGSDTHKRAVSERGAGQDFCNNRQTDDTNNTLGALACERQRSSELRYSPLWKINFVQLEPGVDVGLIDTYADNVMSEIKSANDLFARVETHEFQQPVPQREDEAGNPVPGNDGLIFFNCPASRVAGSVPFPCE